VEFFVEQVETGVEWTWRTKHTYVRTGAFGPPGVETRGSEGVDRSHIESFLQEKWGTRLDGGE